MLAAIAPPYGPLARSWLLCAGPGVALVNPSSARISSDLHPAAHLNATCPPSFSPTKRFESRRFGSCTGHDA